MLIKYKEKVKQIRDVISESSYHWEEMTEEKQIDYSKRINRVLNRHITLATDLVSIKSDAYFMLRFILYKYGKYLSICINGDGVGMGEVEIAKIKERKHNNDVRTLETIDEIKVSNLEHLDMKLSEIMERLKQDSGDGVKPVAG